MIFFFGHMQCDIFMFSRDVSFMSVQFVICVPRKLYTALKIRRAWFLCFWICLLRINHDAWCSIVPFCRFFWGLLLQAVISRERLCNDSVHCKVTYTYLQHRISCAFSVCAFIWAFLWYPIPPSRTIPIPRSILRWFDKFLNKWEQWDAVCAYQSISILPTGNGLLCFAYVFVFL